MWRPEPQDAGSSKRGQEVRVGEDGGDKDDNSTPDVLRASLRRPLLPTSMGQPLVGPRRTPCPLGTSAPKLLSWNPQTAVPPLGSSPHCPECTHVPNASLCQETPCVGRSGSHSFLVSTPWAVGTGVGQGQDSRTLNPSGTANVPARAWCPTTCAWLAGPAPDSKGGQ